MNLSTAKRLSTPECYVCRWAGLCNAVIWPQQLSAFDRRWKIYLSLGTLRSPGMGGSRHLTITVCSEHEKALWQNWIQIAQDEIDLEKAFYDDLERVENEREALYDS